MVPGGLYVFLDLYLGGLRLIEIDCGGSSILVENLTEIYLST